MKRIIGSLVLVLASLACNHSPTEPYKPPVPAARPVVRVNLSTAAPGANLAGKSLIIASGADTIRVTTDASGSIIDSLPTQDSLSNISVYFDGDADFDPMYWDLESVRWRNQSVPLILKPNKWTLDAGLYKDSTYTANMDSLLTDGGGDGASFLSVSWGGQAGQLTYHNVTFDPSRLSVCVYMDRTDSDMPLDSDSVIVWHALDDYISRKGSHSPTPIPCNEADGASGPSVSFQIDTTIDAYGVGGGTTLDGNGFRRQGFIKFKNLLSKGLPASMDPYYVTHEWFHAICMGHTSGWLTMMLGAGTPRYYDHDGMTGQDAAMLDFSYAAAAEQQRVGSPFNAFVGAYNGWRVKRGQPPDNTPKIGIFGNIP